MKTLLAAAALACGVLGCEASLTPAIAPTVDTKGNFGVETRVDLTLGFGDSDHSVVYTGGGPGAGYSGPLGGYFLHSAEVGVQFGGVEKKPLVRGRTGLIFTPRITADEVPLGFGGVVDVLFGVAETFSVSPKRRWGRLLLGGRLQGECVCKRWMLADGTTPPIVGLFSPALVMQWVFIHEPSRFGIRPAQQAPGAP